MTPSERQTIVHARTREYNNILRTTLFAFLGIGAALHFGADSFSLPLLMLTLAVAAFGILSGNACLDDLQKLQGDMTDEFEATEYGQGVRARDFNTFKMASTAIIGLLALANILAVVF